MPPRKQVAEMTRRELRREFAAPASIRKRRSGGMTFHEVCDADGKPMVSYPNALGAGASRARALAERLGA